MATRRLNRRGRAATNGNGGQLAGEGDEGFLRDGAGGGGGVALAARRARLVALKLQKDGRRYLPKQLVYRLVTVLCSSNADPLLFLFHVKINLY